MRPIGIDIDGVLANFDPHYAAVYHKVTGDWRFPYGEPGRDWEVPCWDWPEYFGYSVEETIAVWNFIKADTSFWIQLPPYKDTAENLDLLHFIQSTNTRDVYFTTARVGQTAKRQTEWWLERYGFPRATVLITKHKGLSVRALNLEAVIDDRWENAMDIASAGAKSYLLNRSWNREFPSDGLTRVNSLKEMLVKL